MGTWHLPFSKASINRLEELILRPERVIACDETYKTIGKIFGDDLLFDEMDSLRRKSPDVRPALRKAIKDLLDHYDEKPDDFKEKLEPKQRARINELLTMDIDQWIKDHV